ncbi:MAG: hypothetical protein RLZZ200_676 [Pseudomonadota bacterium]
MRTLVVAPHPDDEVLGAGGTLLRRKAEGGQTAWLIVTAMSAQGGWSEAQLQARAGQIERIRQLFGFDEVFELGFPAAQLDRIDTGELVAAMARVFEAFKPTEVLLPHAGDVHSDHRITAQAAASCTKWFRQASITRVLAYETLSETDAALGSGAAFQPTVFVDVGDFLERKLEALAVYQSELGEFPFPRSPEAVRALAMLRGAAAGFRAAEAYELLRERL